MADSTQNETKTEENLEMENDENSQKTGHVRRLLEQVGLFGKYQLFTCLVIQYASIEWAGSYSFISYLGSLKPDKWNCTTIQGESSIWPSKLNEQQCARVANNACVTLEPQQLEFRSLVPEWKLICDRENIPDIIFSLFLAGQIVGCLVGGHFGDYFGRKRSVFGGQFLVIITSVMSVAARDHWALGVTLLLNGVFLGLIEVSSLTLLMEFTDGKYHFIPNAFFQWTFGYMILSLIAFLTGEWRLYIIFINLCAAPLTIGFMLFHESPRWLIARGHLSKAAHWRTVDGTTKKTRFSPSDLEHVPREEKWRPRTFLSLFANRKLAIQSVLLMSSMFVHDLMTDAYVYTVEHIPGGTFLHMFLFGFLRVWVPFLILYLDWKIESFGRKTLLCCSLGLSCACFGVNIILVLIGLDPLHPAVITLTVIAQLNNESALYMAVIQITAVAYPTLIRCIAFGTIIAVKNIGGLVNSLGLKQLHELWVPSTYIVPTVLLVPLWIAVFMLQEETKGKDMPDRMQDIHNNHNDNTQ